jgi:inner membrane protein
MPSAITHFIVGAGLAIPFTESRVLRMAMSRYAIVASAGAIAAAPDLDTVAMRLFHLAHASVLSHRGAFHAPIVLAVIVTALACLLVRGKAIVPLAAAWTVAVVSHPLLDMLTNGGSGAMLLFPFSTGRFFFGWRPIRVSPLSVRAFFERCGPILLSEAPFAAAALLLGEGLRRAAAGRSETA